MMHSEIRTYLIGSLHSSPHFPKEHRLFTKAISFDSFFGKDKTSLLIPLSASLFPCDADQIIEKPTFSFPPPLFQKVVKRDKPLFLKSHWFSYALLAFFAGVGTGVSLSCLWIEMG